jgi:hypothetical protein
MSLRTFASRTFAARTFNARTWGGVEEAVVTAPSQSGWIARTAVRLSVSPEAQRVSISSTQQRVWVARANNE